MPLFTSLRSPRLATASRAAGAVAQPGRDAPRRSRRSAAVGLPDFTELVERVGPAVVNIRTTERAARRPRPGRPEMDEDMLEFFRRFGIPVAEPARSRAAPPQRRRASRSRAASAPASSSAPTAT